MDPLVSRKISVSLEHARLTLVLTNLLDNASKYTSLHGHIRFSATSDRDDVVLTVSDNGIGITEQALARMFEPFMQKSHASLFNGEGLGIGLTVVRDLGEGHRGRVTAASAGKGKGSEFVVRLPAVFHRENINATLSDKADGV